MGEIKIQWHPAFVAAIRLELAANKDSLIYQQEYHLDVDSFKIDLLVVQKDRNVQMENEIGKMFQGHNLMEYKSPQEPLDIDAFYKAQAYATLYKVYGKKLNEHPADDITVSLVREAKPVKLFHYLKKHKVLITNPYPGIYYVQNGVLFLTQIIVTRELEAEGHTWLKALSEAMDSQSMQALLKTIETENDPLAEELV